MNVTESIRRHALRAPDAEAYVSARGESFTYGIIERTVDALALRLLDLGLVPGNIAAIATNDLYRHLLVGLALARTGIAQAAITLPAQRTDLAVLDHGLEGNGCLRSVALDDLWPADLLSRGAGNPVPLHEDGNALLACFASSGTTGAPKFVAVTHELALRRLDLHALGLDGAPGGRGSPSARQACYVGPATSYGFSSFMLVLGGGGTILERNLEAAEMATWIVRSRASYMVMSPGTLQQIAGVLPTARIDSSLQAVEVGGGILPEQVCRLGRERLCQNLFVNYGSTETGRVAWGQVDILRAGLGAVGHAYPGVEIQIVEDGDRPLPADREGVIRIRSRQNATGYLDDPSSTASVFRDGWVYPGDRGMLEPDGLLRVTGRAAEVIDRGGARINPHAIEAAMMALGGVTEVAVFGATERAVDGAVATLLCAAVVPIEPFDFRAFSQRCRERLGGDSPVFIIGVKQIPLNSSGKVHRMELERIALEARRARTQR